MLGYSNTFIELNSKFKIKILNFNFIFPPINLVTLSIEEYVYIIWFLLIFLFNFIFIHLP